MYFGHHPHPSANKIEKKKTNKNEEKDKMTSVAEWQQ